MKICMRERHHHKATKVLPCKETSLYIQQLPQKETMLAINQRRHWRNSQEGYAQNTLEKSETAQ